MVKLQCYVTHNHADDNVFFKRNLYVSYEYVVHSWFALKTYHHNLERFSNNYSYAKRNTVIRHFHQSDWDIKKKSLSK